MRLATLEAAGRARVPFTTGLLIGIGETRAERIAALFALRDLHERHGHIQEVIVQNFRAKPGTKMASAAEPSLDDLLWTARAAREVLGPEMHIQVPPNLSYDEFPRTLVTVGPRNTLPLEIWNMTTNVTSPALFAIGTVTTAISFLVIASALGSIALIQRRRSQRIVGAAGDAGPVAPDAAGS